jgi:hypothetical protein
MVYVRYSQACIGCNNQKACYNKPGEKPEYCSHCKKEGMINVTFKCCIECGEHRAAYNAKKGDAPLYCGACKKEGMIDVSKRMCVTCSKDYARYNVPGEIPMYCSKCKTEEMKDVDRRRMCAECGAHEAAYNVAGEKPMYCSKCKKDGMEVMRKKQRQCVQCGITDAIYNVAGEKPMYCFKCKKDGMEVIRKKRKQCVKCGIKDARYNNKGEIAMWCSNCKEKGMIDVTKVRCKSEGCDKREWGAGYCASCYQQEILKGNISPQECVRLCKESLMFQALKERFPDLEFHFNQTIQHCARKPDATVYCDQHMLFIECDEKQHKTYDNLEESRRIMQIWEGYGKKPMIVIRFNPDSYKNKKGEKIPSCFYHYDKKLDEQQWNTRISYLSKTIQKNLNPTFKDRPPIQVIKLYYDAP